MEFTSTDLNAFGWELTIGGALIGFALFIYGLRQLRRSRSHNTKKSSVRLTGILLTLFGILALGFAGSVLIIGLAF